MASVKRRDCTILETVQPGVLDLIKLVLDVVALCIKVALLSFLLEMEWLKSNAGFIECLRTARHGVRACIAPSC